MKPKKENEVGLTNEQISYRLALWIEGGPVQQAILWKACDSDPIMRSAITRLAELVKIRAPQLP